MRSYHFSILFAILLSCLAFLQTDAQNMQQKESDSVFQLIRKYINEKDPGNIYALASEQYQAIVNEQALNSFFEKQIFPLGPIKTSSLISLNSDTSNYKLVFASVKLKLSYILNKNGRYDFIIFLPYSEAATIKTKPAATSNPLISIIDKEVDSVARPYIQQANTTGLCIGVLKDGKEYTYGYGETEKGNDNIPDGNTIFEIGSITKTFTATLLAYYVNEHKISLYDPITKYLPDSVSANPELQKIQIINLSNHTSGLSSLPDNFSNYSDNLQNPYQHYTLSMFFSDLKQCKLNTEPGTSYAYSNQGYALLGIILERVSGMSYEEMVKKIITQPLHMTSTEQHVNGALAKRFAKVYNENGEETPAWDFDAMAACGSLRSTVNDLLIYAKNNIICDDTTLSNAFALTHQTTYVKGPMVGLGWHLFIANGSIYYWHNGETGGSRSFLIFNPEKKLAVVVLSNARENADETGINIIKKLR